MRCTLLAANTGRKSDAKNGRLGSVTARHSSSGHQPNFAALNRGRHLYSAGQPSRWALAHISSLNFVIGSIYVRSTAMWPKKLQKFS